MGCIRLQNVTKQFGARVVLADVTLELYSNQIAALVGANGVGKTTLLRLIAGELTPDAGTVTVSRGLVVGYLPQEPDIAAGATLREAVTDAFADLLVLERRLQKLSEQIAAEHQGAGWVASGLRTGRGAARLQELMQEYDRLSARFEAAGGYRFEQRLNEILGGLGFLPAEYDLPLAALSGGQKCRAALAKLLLQGPGFLLLDEPTNHLDIDALRWLEKFLAGHGGGAVIISHDRYLLDRLAQRTIELDAAKLTSYPTNFSGYLQVRATRRLTQQRRYEQDREFIAREQEYIARSLVGRRGKQVQGRRTRLQRRLAAGELVLEKPAHQATVRLDFGPGGQATQVGKELVRLQGLRKQYGQKLLFSNLDLVVKAGDRLGITGPNGTGKTTLLRIIRGQVEADAGTVYVNPATRIGYFAQEATDLDPNRTIVDEIRSVRPDFLERQARHFAARFLFTGDEPFKKIGELSGGEQSRLRFMKLVLEAPDLLLLDEPTNHLDIPSRAAFETALLDFPGTVIVVSHDRYFLDRVVRRLLVMRLGDVRLYHGNYSDYIAQVEQARAAEQSRDREGAEAAARQAASAATQRGARRLQDRPQRSGSAAHRSPLAKLTLEELEAYIAEREKRLSEVQQRFGDSAVYRDVAAVAQLRADYDTLRVELAAAEAAWLEKAEKA